MSLLDSPGSGEYTPISEPYARVFLESGFLGTKGCAPSRQRASAKVPTRHAGVRAPHFLSDKAGFTLSGLVDARLAFQADPVKPSLFEMEIRIEEILKRKVLPGLGRSCEVSIPNAVELDRFFAGRSQEGD